MSIWSECEGVLRVPIESHFSVRKALENLYDEGRITTSQRQNTVFFNYTFSLEGKAAANLIQQLIDHIKTYKNVEIVQLTSMIRWY